MQRIWTVLACAGVVACTPGPAPRSQAEEPRPEQAGQPLDPLRTAGRMAAVQAAAIAQDQDAVQRRMGALQEDLRKSMKLADPARRVDPEAARMAARQVEGVRSVAWIDRENLLVLVDRNEVRSQATIDRICVALEPLGDTLGVVVNVQSAAARTGDELQILSRNCQLAPGDRALLQRRRQVDVIDPAIRAQHRAAQAAAALQGDRSAEQAESMRIIQATTPEM